MQENWEVNWEDYYEILQVHPSAELEVIQAAYRKLVQKYHPDINKDPLAAERMKKINVAYEVLSNSEKRKRYDSEWFQKEGTINSSSRPKPKPTVEPGYICFKDVEPKDIQTASFIVRNTGGLYSRLLVDNPDSWLKVIRGYSLTNSSELPAQIEIEAEGDDWDKSYSGIIRVRLDEEETQVRVELQTKPVPVRERHTTGARPKTGYTHTPPPKVAPKHRLPIWGKWLVGLAIFGLLVGISTIISFLASSAYQSKISQSQSAPIITTLESHVSKYRSSFSPNKEVDPQIEISLKDWIRKTLNLKIDWVSLKVDFPISEEDYIGIEDYATIGESIWVVGDRMGNSFVFYSPDKGKSWKIQWQENTFPWDRSQLFIVYFLNGKEGWAGGKGNLLHTNDGGNSWLPQPLPGEYWKTAFWFETNPQRIVVRLRNDEIYESFDGGRNWGPSLDVEKLGDYLKTLKKSKVIKLYSFLLKKV